MTTFRVLVLVCSLLPAAVAIAAAGELVVIASDAPGLAPGQIVQADTVIEIPDGASITLVSDSGRTLTLQGPHSGPPGPAGGAASPGLVTSLSNLLAAPDKETAALGVMRRVTRHDRAPPDDPWIIDVGRSGHQCISADGQATLWRAGSDRALTVSISNITPGDTTEIDWPAGAATRPWPPDVMLADGAEYLARIPETGTVARFSLHILPAELPSDAHRAAWMADRGCDVQARRLLTRLR